MLKETTIKRNSALLNFIFFSNYFYGVSAVGLTIEATVQQRLPLNGFVYYFLIFIGTVLFYAYPYIRKGSGQSIDPRANWYTRHYQFMRWNQIIITIILAAALFFFLKDYGKLLLHMPLYHWGVIAIFPFAGALYYGSDRIIGKRNLRRIGWLKPFIISFCWAGFVTVYPVIYYDIIHQLHYHPVLVNVLLFLKNFMFISMLCVLFDIKDYAADYIAHVRTLVLQFGLRKIIFTIIPLSLIGFAVFVFYAVTHDFSLMKIMLNTIPFMVLILVTWSMRRRHSLMYYLIVIDGTMLVKAVLGTIAMIYF